MTDIKTLVAKAVLVSFVTLYILSYCQSIASSQTPPPDKKVDPATKVYRVPMLLLSDFELNAGSDPVVRGMIAGRSYWFTIDTGLSLNLIKQSVQKEAGLKYVKFDLSEVEGEEDAFIIGGKVQEAEAKIDMGEVVVPDVPFWVCEDNKIGKHLVKEDRTVAGVLGASFLRSRAVVFDYDQRELRIRPRGNLTPEAVKEMGFGDSVAVVELRKVKPDSHPLMADVLCNGKNIPLMVDTGGESSFLLTLPPGLDLSSAEDNTVRMFQGEFAIKDTAITMTLGGLEVSNVPVSILTDARKPDGIGNGVLGRDLLMRFNFLIDFPGKKMYLKHRRNLERDK